MVGSFKIKASPAELFFDKSPVIPNSELVNVHTLIKRLLSKEMLTRAVDIPLSERISNFLVNSQKLILNQDILLVVKGYTILFIKMPFQQNSKFSKNEQEANCSRGFGIKRDVEEMGNKKNSTCSTYVQSEQRILCGKKRRRLSPCNHPKILNQSIPFLHFKMKDLL